MLEAAGPRQGTRYCLMVQRATGGKQNAGWAEAGREHNSSSMLVLELAARERKQGSTQQEWTQADRKQGAQAQEDSRVGH